MSPRTPRRYSPVSNRRAPEAPPFRTAALDGGVVSAVSLLAAIGLVGVYSITAPMTAGSLPPEFGRHIAAITVSVLLCATVLQVPLTFWRRIAVPLWGISVVALLATWAIGIEVKGAQRWIGWSSLRVQPAEFAKFATVVAMAAFLSQNARKTTQLKPFVAAAAVCAPPIALLLAQPDFGSSLVICAVVGVLLFVSGTPMRQLGAAAMVGLLGTGAYIAMRPYAYSRWTGFLDPWATASREGFQLVQSFIAFSRGGSFGVPLGDGRQKLYYLPEAHTDFILSGIAEEAGLFGVLVVLGAFAAFVAAGTRIAARAEDAFASLLAFGMTALVGIPAAINAAVVMGLLPTTGFTLPFVSFGANSMIVSAVAVGVLLRIGACEAAPGPTRFSGASRRAMVRS